MKNFSKKISDLTDEMSEYGFDNCLFYYDDGEKNGHTMVQGQPLVLMDGLCNLFEAILKNIKPEERKIYTEATIYGLNLVLQALTRKKKEAAKKVKRVEVTFTDDSSQDEKLEERLKKVLLGVEVEDDDEDED